LRKAGLAGQQQANGCGDGMQVVTFHGKLLIPCKYRKLHSNTIVYDAETSVYAGKPLIARRRP
jgi:hypothetical protein